MPLTRLPAVTLLLVASAATAAEPVDFARDVGPILAARCQACHGPAKQQSGLRLDSPEAVRRGASSGPVVAGKSADSPLIRHVTGRAEPRMPPKGEPLSPAEVATLVAWIDQGARGESAGAKAAEVWWSLKPLSRPTVPDPSGSPVDAFLLAKLREKGLKFSPEAGRRTLIRRLSVDLTGLPPTPDEIDGFLKDAAPDAYDRLVERLLASPRYGERWARHWMDVAHYADSHGHDQDRARPNAWPYRDYLIPRLQ